MKKILSLVIAFAMVAMTAMTAFADTATPYTIFGTDSREPVQDTTISPYSAVCNLTIHWSNGDKTYGTGFLISSTRVVTTAHCMYNRSNGATATSIIVAPGDTPSKHPYGTTTVTGSSNFKYQPKYETAQGNDVYLNDYGYIKLSENAFTGTPATLSMNVYKNESSFTNMPATLIGYDYKTADQYETSGKIEYVKNGRLYHKMDTLSGMSGSPILDKNNKVVGINAYSIGGTLPAGNKVADDYPDSNKATWITQDVSDFLTKG